MAKEFKKEFKHTAAVSAGRSAGAGVGTAAPYALLAGVAAVGLWLAWRRYSDPLGNAVEGAKADVDGVIVKNYSEKVVHYDDDAIREMADEGNLSRVTNQVVIDEMKAQGLHVMSEDDWKEFLKDPHAYEVKRGIEEGWSW